MKQFKIRASATADIMAYPEKSELPVGAVTYLQNWLREQIYGRKKDFTSKYTDKGINCEEGSIELVSEHYGWGLVSKNEKFYEDDFKTGTPDLVLAELIPDIKNSWDCFTFPLFGEKLDPKYDWQMQTYMSLTGKDAAAVIYTLMDAPDELVEAEARKLSYKAGFNELDADFYEQVKANMTYSHLPIELLVKRFDVFRDDKKINQINNRVEACREWISKIDLSKFKTHNLKAA